MNIIVDVILTLTRQAVIILFAFFTSLVERTTTLAFIHLNVVLRHTAEAVVLRIASFAVILGRCASGAFPVLEEK